ncbi:MAG: signal peptidase II [Chloroflexi bacterium]|nr:signal peptidase II [Chloroflexota bacterium]
MDPLSPDQSAGPGAGEPGALAAEVAPTAGPAPARRALAWWLDLYLAGVLIATFAIDQVTKRLVRDNLPPDGSIPAEGLFRITHTTNTGMAFGLFPGQNTLLVFASLIGIGILLVFFRNQPISPVWLRASLGLQLGGAAGNLADRLTLGTVVDFIDVGVWPVFNLADSSIVVGLVILAWFLLRPSAEGLRTPKRPLAKEQPSGPEPPALASEPRPPGE